MKDQQLRHKYQFIQPHDNKRAKMRNLHRVVRPLLECGDPLVQEQIQRIRQSVEHDPTPEYALYNLLFAAKQSSDDTGVSWLDALTYMVDKFIEEKK